MTIGIYLLLGLLVLAVLGTVICKSVWKRTAFACVAAAILILFVHNVYTLTAYDLRIRIFQNTIRPTAEMLDAVSAKFHAGKHDEAVSMLDAIRAQWTEIDVEGDRFTARDILESLTLDESESGGLESTGKL